jgi:hypothetical protein
MALPLYMDARIPAAITAGLRLRGVDVQTCQEDGTDRFPDDQLMERATNLGRILFSQDDDLLGLAKEWRRIGRHFVGVIYAHQLSCGIGTLVRDLELTLSYCNADELADTVMYLPLR